MALLALAGVSVIALAATAAEHMAALDENEDGMLSFEELLVGYPALETSVFESVDVNGDGMLDATELAAAEEAGVLPERAG